LFYRAALRKRVNGGFSTRIAQMLTKKYKWRRFGKTVFNIIEIENN